MRMRKLTADGDMTFGSGQLDFYRDVPEAVGQAVKTRLLLWLGEWFLDINEGTAYMLGILGKHKKETANVTVQDRILGTQGMVSIENFESEINPDSRGYSLSSDINTIYGPTELDVQNYTNF